MVPTVLFGVKKISLYKLVLDTWIQIHFGKKSLDPDP